MPNTLIPTENTESLTMTFLNKCITLNKKQTLLCSLLCVASMTAGAANADSQGWNMVSDESGVTVSTRAVANHDINEIKTTTKLKATVNQLVALYMDVDKCGLWAENCGSAKILNRLSDNEFDLYRMIENPWPFSNRDYLLHVKVEKSAKTGATTITYENLKDKMAENDCCIRSNIVKGYWKFTPAADGFTQVTYQFHTDPGGALPASLLNSVMPDLPVNLLKAISKEVSKASD